LQARRNKNSWPNDHTFKVRKISQLAVSEGEVGWSINSQEDKLSENQSIMQEENKKSATSK
jgi:hypothetical protein